MLPECPENYQNIKFMLDKLNTEAFESVTSADLKMCKLTQYIYWILALFFVIVNILVGKSVGNPSYGCPFCDSCKPYNDPGCLYKVQDLVSLHKVFIYFLSNHFFDLFDSGVCRF